MVNKNKQTSVSTDTGSGVGYELSLSKQRWILSEIKKNTYKQYSPSDLRDCVIQWVLQKRKTGLRSFCRKRKIPRKTVCNYLKEMPLLAEMRETGGQSMQIAEALYDDYMKNKTTKINKQLIQAREGNYYMNEDEECTLANIAKLMAS